MKSIEEIKLELKNQIIQELNLEGLTPEDIEDNLPLFGEGLGLDSIDSLELIVILEKFHNVHISNEKEGRQVLQSIQSMAEHIVKLSENQS